MAGILGKKVGMTTIFSEKGEALAVTVIDAEPSVVLARRTSEKDGYSALLLGYRDKKLSRVNKPEKAWFDKIKVSPKRFIKEIRTEKNPEEKVGDKLNATLFKKGEYVDVSGITKGKGFQGGMKRWNWTGGESGHGSMFHRAPGSIGASSDPSRVFKGQHLPGHMGAVKRTAQNLEIIDVDPEKNLIVIKGSVSGPNGGFLILRHAKKIKVKPEAAGKEKDKQAEKDEKKK